MCVVVEGDIWKQQQLGLLTLLLAVSNWGRGRHYPLSFMSFAAMATLLMWRRPSLSAERERKFDKDHFLGVPSFFLRAFAPN